MCSAIGLAQQKRTVSGSVKDTDGHAVAQASYLIKGTNVGGVTDANGRFSIAVDGSNAVLVFSFVGFTTEEVAVGTQTTLTVTLQRIDASLSDVVVTALGVKRQKKSLGYAVQQVKGSTLLDAREPNLTNALSGVVAGLQVIRSSNGPAGSSKIILRGNNSLTGSNQPLIVVDGVPVDNFTGASNNDYWNPSLDMGNGLADLNADDIESISVLKGPSAAALYGTRAGNGVILISTKTGKSKLVWVLRFPLHWASKAFLPTPNCRRNLAKVRMAFMTRLAVLTGVPKLLVSK
jgi:Outer membrane cobalamin receptor protein